MDMVTIYGEKNYKEKFYEKEKEIVCFECVLYEYDELYKWIKH